MVNNLNQAIEMAIDKKLEQGVSGYGQVKDLVKYSKYGSLRGYNLSYLNHALESFDFDSTDMIARQRDLYNNKVYNFMKVRKTQCRFNLIKMFRPGEILNSVISN